jgi:hypothetical protein
MQSKKLTCNWDLRQVVIYLRPRTPYPTPSSLHTVYLYTLYLFTQGRGEEGRVERGARRQQFTKLGRKYRLHLQSIHSDKHLPQIPFTGQFFRWRHFALLSTYLISPWLGASVHGYLTSKTPYTYTYMYMYNVYVHVYVYMPGAI